MGLQGSAWKRLKYFLSYAFVDATYQTDVTLASVTEPDGVLVKPGDRIPGIPQQNLKFGAEVAVLDNLWIGGGRDLRVGQLPARRRRQPAGQGERLHGAEPQRALRPHQVPRDLGTRRQRDERQLRTAGALNWNAFADPISVQRFVAPGAPIGGWAGVKVRF